ncbi:MAG: serine/threonine-protein kinase [Myxococcota bacterium]|nr:serine/threonine-protein kinase [Myxococcota bacterium]
MSREDLRQMTQLGGRYRIGAPLGAGSAGEVFEAFDEHLADRSCALKILRREKSWGVARQRFEREIEMIASLHSPFIVPPLDWGVSDTGLPYLVMERLRGETLRERLMNSEAFSEAEIERLTWQLAQGLSAAHQRGIIHRDLKPANLFLCEGWGDLQLRILDFGVARWQSPDLEHEGEALPDQEVTQAGMTVGTPLYMAPEQFSSAKVDHRADLYSFGVILYELVYGHPPYQAQEALLPASIRTLTPSLQYAWLHTRGPAPTLNGSSFDPLIQWSLQRRAENRPQSALQLIDWLENRHPFVDVAQPPPPPLPVKAEQYSSTAPADGLQESIRQIEAPSGPHSESRVNSETRVLSFDQLTRENGGERHISRPAYHTKRESPFLRKRKKKIPVEISLALLMLLLLGSAGLLLKRFFLDQPFCEDQILSTPSGANIWSGARLVGETPLTLSRPCGETLSFRLSLNGYEDRSFSISGTGSTWALPLSPSSRATVDIVE